MAKYKEGDAILYRSWPYGRLKHGIIRKVVKRFLKTTYVVDTEKIKWPQVNNIQLTVEHEEVLEKNIVCNDMCD